MPTETSARGLSSRLAALPPDKRALLLQKLMQSPTAEGVPVEEIPLQPRDGRDFPLSAAQERMWFNHQWSPDQPIYNESFGLLAEGELKTDLLQKSFDLVMARHEIFRVTFHSSDGRLSQRLASGIVPGMEIFDLRGLPEPQREDLYQATSWKLLREPFRLQEGPLFRAGVWTTDDGAHRLIFVMHHMIFDGWSGGIFLRELLAGYAELVRGKEPQWSPVGAQYVDFAVWEQSRLAEPNAELDSQLDYWKKQLEGVSGPPALPVDRHLADGEAHAAGREIFECPPATANVLRALAKESGATPFMALLTIFKLLLARYSGQEDIVVAIPTTNRSQSALRNIVGVFTNTAILRTEVPGEVSFRELMGRVRKTTLDAQANQEIPLQRVVRLLDGQSDSGRFLLRVLFDLQKKSGHMQEVPGLSIRPLDTSNGVAKFDLVLAFEETADELKGVLDYDAARFEAATARQLVRHFLALVDAAVAQPDLPTNRLTFLSSEDLIQSVVHGLDTSGQSHPFAHQATLARAIERPESRAMANAHVTFSYGEMQSRAMRLAAFLQRNHVGRGHHVALLLPAGPDLVIAQLGITTAGAAFVPIDPAYPEARIEFMLRDCEARFVVVEGKSSASRWANSINLESDCPPLRTKEPISVPAPADSDPAYMIYTSGSTGQPKGVSVSYAALGNLVAWHSRAFAISPADRAAPIASVAFDASIWEIWPYLATGASVHFPPRELIADAAALRGWLLKNAITITFAPTPLAEELIALRWPKKVSLRYLLTGGDRLRKFPPEDLPFILINNYGPTENTVVATSGVVAGAGDAAPPSIGRPIDNVSIRIVDRALQPVPCGAPGELMISGRSLAKGYWNLPEITSGAFKTLDSGERGERVYLTGDLCRFRRNGEIEYLGRFDRQIKLRGYRIELGEIESALLAHEGIHDAVAEVRELAGGQKVIVAYYVPAAGALTVESLRSFLAGRLTSYMLPTSFVRLDIIPKTASGKIDRKRLPPPEPARAPEQPFDLPHSATERQIAELWKGLLRVDRVDLHDDFFALGGDSLLATRFAAQVRETFAIELPLGRMMNAPTVKALARLIDGSEASGRQLPRGMVLLRSGGPNKSPLFFTPPASGSPASYTALVEALGEDRTVYGFESDGLSAGKPIDSINEQARSYIAALEQVYPHGPCLLSGWSLGGPVAFEMACQLRAAGREVAFLGLIDSGLPENGRLPGGASLMIPLWWAISYPFVERIPLNYKTVRMLARWVGILLPDSLGDVWRRGLAGGSKFAASILASGWRSMRVFRVNLRAFSRFQPSFFDGQVTLFRTAQGAELDKTQDFVRESLGRWCAHVDMHEAPGSHMTLMLDPAVCSEFAPCFHATLSRALQVSAHP
ncbi:MAG: amino acid adenylation domain-containing protein [Acidobacteriaceae bacterium]